MSRGDSGPVLRVTRWRVLSGVVGFIAVAALVRLFGRGEFWLVALPGYLTGAGTLGLAVVAYLTMVQEAEDRRTLQAAAERDRERAERERQRAEHERRRAEEGEARERRRLEAQQRRRQAEGVQVEPTACRGGAGEEWRFDTKIANLSDDSISNLVLYFATTPRAAQRGDASLPEVPRRLIAGQAWTAQTIVKHWVVHRRHHPYHQGSSHTTC